ncbi:MAG: glycoside hydrolase family 9 protein [Acidobacteriota bacterium]|jgi:endoglucanase|nr:glycoside hydrolase family 9 protein [Acidobacteriota bacterium]
MLKKTAIMTLLAVFCGLLDMPARPTLKEIRSASDDVLVVFIAGDSGDVNAIDIEDASRWKVNGEAARAVYKYSTRANPFDHHVYLKTAKLEEGKQYRLETPYGDKDMVFRAREVYCEAVKTNQVGYSAQSRRRYANFAIWLGTGGAGKIAGALPAYEVWDVKTGKTVADGTLEDVGEDAGSGDRVYRIDLGKVPEGGPYKVTVKGYGSSHPFGVGGRFSQRLAYTLFRAQYLQRCGCPIHKPDIRKKPCHTLVYDVDGPIGEANIDVKGDERTLRVYGGYHDAGDADRRAYHMANPVINLMIYEAFPEYFTDGQYDLPGKFDAEYNILGYDNGVPDILDEAAWGSLAWEYLQNEDGSIHFGTETRGYPEPFAAPLDQDGKKYGTVKTDDRATNTGAGLFMHLARVLKPFDAKRSEELVARAEKAMRFGDQSMAAPERLYYHIQRYLLLGEETDHRKVKELYRIAGGLKDNLYLTPGYSLNDDKFDNPAYIISYIVEKKVATDPAVVAFFKQAVKDAADANIAELRRHAYPVGNNPDGMAWGHNVRQPQYAAAPLLQWRLSGGQEYFDAASELMDYKLGLNPVGVSYVTGLGVQQVYNVHDRESAYTASLGRGSKPGITVFGPGVPGWSRTFPAVPDVAKLPKERQYVDDREIISFNEFTIFETMHYDALYTVLAGGGKWEP